MPFTSKRQARKCYAMKARGDAGSWDCSEWSEHTNFKKLPEKAAEGPLDVLTGQGLQNMHLPQSLGQATGGLPGQMDPGILAALVAAGLIPAAGGLIGGAHGFMSAPKGYGIEGASYGSGVGAGMGTGLVGGAALGGLAGAGLGALTGTPGMAAAGGLAGAGLGGYGGMELGRRWMHGRQGAPYWVGQEEENPDMQAAMMAKGSEDKAGTFGVRNKPIPQAPQGSMLTQNLADPFTKLGGLPLPLRLGILTGLSSKGCTDG